MSPALVGVGEPAPDGHDVGASQQAANDAGSRPLALIVDDSRFLALHLARQLEGLGFRAYIPADAADLREHAARAAVVCIELELFHASGFEVMRELAERCTCPLVLLTGTGRNTDMQWGLRAGARAVLRRPVTVETLRAAFTRIACGGGP